jgi:hypothetical protein
MIPGRVDYIYARTLAQGDCPGLPATCYSEHVATPLPRNRALLAIFLLSLLPWRFRLEACDPNHNWQEVSILHRASVPVRAVEALLLDGLGRCPPSPDAGNRVVALVHLDLTAAHAHPINGAIRPPGAPPQGVLDAQLLDDLRTDLARNHITLITPPEVRARLKAAGEPDSPVLTPSGFKTIASGTKATLFMKLTVLEANHMVRLDRDATPKNKGLYSQFVIETARGRLSVQEPGGNFVVLDEILGSNREGFMYFGKNALPDQVDRFVEVGVDRPGQESVSYKDPSEKTHQGL